MTIMILMSASPNPGGNGKYIFPVFLLTALIAMPALLGCASSEAIRPGPEGQGHYINGVPFYSLSRQEENSCGPAALAGVISFWDGQVSLEQIVANVYLPELRGSLPMDMEQFMREAGFETKSLAGTVDELKAQIRRNVPVISLLDFGFGPYRRPHYVTVIGFDDAKRVIIAHDGLRANKKIEYEKFMKEWARAGYWMLVAVPGWLHAGDKQ